MRYHRCAMHLERKDSRYHEKNDKKNRDDNTLPICECKRDRGRNRMERHSRYLDTEIEPIRERFVLTSIMSAITLDTFRFRAD